jgi:hypothetical protein
MKQTVCRLDWRIWHSFWAGMLDAAAAGQGCALEDFSIAGNSHPSFRPSPAAARGNFSPFLRESQNDVIPAKAGIQRLENLQRHWIPAFAGMTS